MERSARSKQNKSPHWDRDLYTSTDMTGNKQQIFTIVSSFFMGSVSPTDTIQYQMRTGMIIMSNNFRKNWEKWS
jgi:hypothetical protein